MPTPNEREVERELPTWLDIDRKVHDQNVVYEITPLERFVHEYEPANDNPLWRARLSAVLTAENQRLREALEPLIARLDKILDQR